MRRTKKKLKRCIRCRERVKQVIREMCPKCYDRWYYWYEKGKPMTERDWRLYLRRRRKREAELAEELAIVEEQSSDDGNGHKSYSAMDLQHMTPEQMVRNWDRIKATGTIYLKRNRYARSK